MTAYTIALIKNPWFDFCLILSYILLGYEWFKNLKDWISTLVQRVHDSFILKGMSNFAHGFDTLFHVIFLKVTIEIVLDLFNKKCFKYKN